MNRGKVVAFVKDPVSDDVNTRLGKSIGNYSARVFYELSLRILADQFSELNKRGLKPLLATTSEILPPKLVSIFGHMPFVFQGSGNIGQRIAQIDNLLRKPKLVFDPQNIEQPHQKILYIGSDAPTLSTKRILDVYHSLTSVDAAFAPAQDGGFTVMGSRLPLPLNEQSIRWSSRKTLVDTMGCLIQHGFTLATHSVWYDVDEWNDLIRVFEFLSRQKPISPNQALLLGFIEECKKSLSPEERFR